MTCNKTWPITILHADLAHSHLGIGNGPGPPAARAYERVTGRRPHSPRGKLMLRKRASSSQLPLLQADAAFPPGLGGAGSEVGRGEARPRRACAAQAFHCNLPFPPPSAAHAAPAAPPALQCSSSTARFCIPRPAGVALHGDPSPASFPRSSRRAPRP